VDLIEMRLVRA